MLKRKIGKKAREDRKPDLNPNNTVNANAIAHEKNVFVRVLRKQGISYEEIYRRWNAGDRSLESGEVREAKHYEEVGKRALNPPNYEEIGKAELERLKLTRERS